MDFKNNQQRWKLICSELESPQSFIDVGYYFSIASILQRRVWCFGNLTEFGWPEDRSIFSNTYMVLTGPAGAGKGRVLNEIFNLITHWKKNDCDQETTGIIREDGSNLLELRVPSYKGNLTFPKLVQKIQKSITKYDCKTNKGGIKAYLHNSYTLLSEEFETLFRNISDTEDLSNFMLIAYDCGEYAKETMGDDTGIFIRNMCLSFIAGVTPVSIKECFKTKLLSDGFASRCIFVYGDKPQKRQFQAPITDDIKQAQGELKDYVKGLTELFGPANFTPRAFSRAKEYYENDPSFRINQHPILDGYYARKKVHLIKMCLAVHFAEKLSMEINLDDVTKAIKILEGIEGSMHKAIEQKAANVFADVTEDIFKFIRREGGVTRGRISLEFSSRLEHRKLQDILDTLVEQERIKSNKNGTGKPKYESVGNL